MDLTHLHLLLNHVPTVGTIMALGLLIFGLAGKSFDLKRASLVMFLGISLVTIATYVTGNIAERKICKSKNAADACIDQGVSKGRIHRHEAAAMVAFIGMELTGAFAWLGLWQIRRSKRLPNGSVLVVLVLALVTFGIVAYAANLGGEIRHPEVRAGDFTENLKDVPLARQVGSWVVGTKWVWPVCETLHFIGLSLLFAVSAVVDLRMLGMMKGLSFPQIHRLLPWGILGFGINMVTGMLFFIGIPEQYTENPVFHWKILLMMLTGANVLYFTVFDEPWEIKAGDDAPFIAKAVAASALVLVLGVLYCGRMLPFLGDAF